MKNKKAWMRIFEAFLAVILVAGALLILVSTQRAQQTFEEDIHSLERSILMEISSNDALRQEVLNINLAPILSHAESKIPPGMNFTMRICPIDDICGKQGIYVEEIYAEEIVISSTLETHPNNAKKLKIFLWEE